MRQDLEKCIDAFKEFKFWPLCALNDRLRQPESQLLEVIEMIAVLNKGGRYDGTYQLKPEALEWISGEDTLEYQTDTESRFGAVEYAIYQHATDIESHVSRNDTYDTELKYKPSSMLLACYSLPRDFLRYRPRNAPDLQLLEACIGSINAKLIPQYVNKIDK